MTSPDKRRFAQKLFAHDDKINAKVGQALNVTTMDSGKDLYGELRIAEGPPPKRIKTLPRVGIDYAKPKDRDALWRFVAMESV